MAGTEPAAGRRAPGAGAGRDRPGVLTTRLRVNGRRGELVVWTRAALGREDPFPMDASPIGGGVWAALRVE